jgi:hypothetical protein
MVLRSFLDGLRRVLAAPAVLTGVFALTFLMAVPLAVTLRGMLQAHLGGSLMANEAADAVNHGWWQEFTSQAAGLGASFSPSIIGFAAVLDNTSSVLDAQREIAPVAGALGAYLLLWTFLVGGIIDRYARQRATRANGFFGASGVFFWRFVRLAIVAGFVYWFLFAYVHEWLFDTWFRNATRDLNVERTAFFWRVGMYAIFGALLVAANIIFDYAKVRAVVEDRLSMLGALGASIGFIRRNFGRVASLYVVNVALFLVVVAVWALVAPGAGRTGMSMWAGFILGQLYLLARLFVKLQFLASQTALFQASLAHAAYTAAPEPVWPESPAAETITVGSSH